MTVPPADGTGNAFNIGLFTGIPQHDNFCRMKDLGRHTSMTAAKQPFEWPVGERATLPETFEIDGQSKSCEQFLNDTDTGALLVVIDGKVVYERYLLTGGPKVNWLSMSVGKSFIATLVGIAVDEGHITTIDEPISKYVPVNPGSAYDGPTIRQVLQMSSGARWNEDYSDPTCDIMQLVLAQSTEDGGGLDKFVANMVKETEPDTVCRYNSGETQVLGCLIARATGKSVTAYMQEKLVEPMGFESPGYWCTDMFGVEMSYGGLNLTARDFAKLGELYRNKGVWNGKRIVSEKWITNATRIDSPIREAGKVWLSDHTLPLGYGFQWWIPPGGNDGDFSAIGVYNQFVYVNPARNAVIVKLSANRKYGTSMEEADNQDTENLYFLRRLAEAL